MRTGFVTAVVLLALLAGTVSAQAQEEFQMPRTEEGWTDLQKLLVPSDGSRSLGDTNGDFNDTRDRGSKIVFFDPEKGDNETAEVYWWDGQRIVDSSGSATGADRLKSVLNGFSTFFRRRSWRGRRSGHTASAGCGSSWRSHASMAGWSGVEVQRTQATHRRFETVAFRVRSVCAC